MNYKEYVFQDWQRNQGNIKSRYILAFFRFSQLVKKSRTPILIKFIPLFLYRILVEWVLGVELPWNTNVGSGLVIFHGQSLVVNDHSIIGDNCTLRNSTTIGNKMNIDGTYSESPIIGDNVDIGANVSIIGPIKIGDNVVIGAGTVVVKDVPSGATVVGNPARVLNVLS